LHGNVLDTVADWLERTPCNEETTGSILLP